MTQIVSDSPRELSSKLRESIDPINPRLELRLEYQGRQIPLTATGLRMLSRLESERAYEELIRPGPPYRSGNLDQLNGFSTGSRGRELAEQELIPSGLIEIDPNGDSKEIYRLSDLAQEGKYVALVRDERVNS